jgi:ParB-like chromosome segregation protein Spo0J
MQKIIGTDLIVDINAVRPNTWNPKESIEDNTENKQRYEEIKAEIEKKGLFEAITVRELSKDNYEILDGFHRWKACNELDFKEIRINNLGTISDKLARAITVIKEQKKVPVDELMVASIIGEMVKQGEDVTELQELFGYDEEQINDYIKMFDFNWDEFQSNYDESQSEKEDKLITCPKCGHNFKQ